MDREPDKCYKCGAETTLSVSGKPICVKCNKERDGRLERWEEQAVVPKRPTLKDSKK